MNSRDHRVHCGACHCDRCGRCGYASEMDIVVGCSRHGAYLRVLCATCSEAHRIAEIVDQVVELGAPPRRFDPFDNGSQRDTP